MKLRTSLIKDRQTRRTIGAQRISLKAETEQDERTLLQIYRALTE
jgi:hypothetical protein